MAYLIVRDDAAAQDITAETLMTALAKGDRLRDPEALRAWLLRIATNLGDQPPTSGRARHRAAIRPRHRHVRAAAVDALDRLAISQAVVRLPVRMRAAIVLHYYADLPVDDVATAMGVSPNTVKTQLRVALERLRVSLTEPNATTELRHA